MKFGTVLLTILFSASALIGVVWLGQLQPISIRKAELLEQERINSAQKIEKFGPQPKAVADEINFDFRLAVVGNEYSHIFVLKNEGEASLTLKKGKSTCQCTVSSLETGKDLKVPPGESVEITLTWTPKEADERFSHSADIETNDSNSRIITFEIHGKVIERIITMPPEIWSMPDILDNAPTKFSGHIGSAVLEEFQIKGLKTTHPLLSAKYIKVSKTDLTQYQMKSGYRIDLKIEQGVPVGPFNESLSIITNVENATTYTLNVRSHRYGPITIRPIQHSKWNAELMGLNMGSFAASEGRTSILHMYVKGRNDKDLKFRDIEVDPKYLQFSLTPDASFSGKSSKRYVLTFKIPPGTPKASRLLGAPARVHLKTNHPELPEIIFLIHFVSL